MRAIIQFVMAWTLVMASAACAVSPKPAATPSFGNPLVTPTGGPSPLSTSTRGASPLGSPILSPLATPTIAASPQATLTPVASMTPLPPSSTATPLPSATPLIAVSTPTSLPPASTSARVISSPAAVLLPTVAATRVPTRIPVPAVSPILVTAWVSETDPRPGVDVKVYGRLLVDGQPVKGEGMVARWHLKGGSFVDCVGDTGADGVASCTENTYGLPAGFTVRIEVFIKYNQAPYRAVTELTIDD